MDKQSAAQYSYKSGDSSVMGKTVASRGDKRDYVQCFFIPLSKLKALPTTEIDKMKKVCTIQGKDSANPKSNDRMFNYMGKLYGLKDDNTVYRY